MVTPEARARRRVRTPVLVVTASAWLVLLGADLLSAGGGRGSPGAWLAASVALHPTSSSPPAGLGTHTHVSQHVGAGVATQGPALSLSGFLTGWGLMLTAMMAPLLIPALRHIRDRSLRRRRWRAMCLTTAAYAATWSTAGVLLLLLAAAPMSLTGRADVGLATGLVVAVAWQASPAKQRCLNRHHARPTVAAFGWAADRDALRLGGAHAGSCLGSCWALMLLPLLAPSWHLGVMAVVSAWMWAEQLDEPTQPAWKLHLPPRAIRLAASTARSARRPVWVPDTARP